MGRDGFREVAMDSDDDYYDPDPQPSDLTPAEDMPIGSLARMVEELESSPTALAEHFQVTGTSCSRCGGPLRYYPTETGNYVECLTCGRF